MKLTFWGAAQTVTGSLHMLEFAGRRVFLDWLAEDLNYDDFAVRESFMMKVFFWGELETGEAIEKLKAYIDIHRKKLESYQVIDGLIQNYAAFSSPSKARFWGFTARHGFAYSEGCIRWAEDALALLQEEE